MKIVRSAEDAGAPAREGPARERGPPPKKTATSLGRTQKRRRLRGACSLSAQAAATLAGVLPLKAVLACLAVLVAGSAAVFAVPWAFDLRDGDARAADLGLALTTAAAFVAVARRMVPRPYLRRQTVTAALAAPFAVALAVAAVLVALDVAGADCPRAGMDYIAECNDLAGASMVVFFLGTGLVALLVVIAAAVLLAAGAKRIRAGRRTTG